MNIIIEGKVMKPIIFIAILNLSFCFIIFAQTDNCKKPELVDEFANSEGGSKKERIQNVSVLLNASENCFAKIRIAAKTKSDIFRQTARLRKGLLFLRMPLERFSFLLLTNSKEEKVQFWISPKSDEIPNCEECILIRAKDFDKIEELFKPTTKKLKN